MIGGEAADQHLIRSDRRDVAAKHVVYADGVDTPAQQLAETFIVF